MCYISACYLNGCFGIVCNDAGTRAKQEWEIKGMKFPGWAGVFSAAGEVAAFAREKGNGEAMVVAELDPEDLNAQRRNEYFRRNCSDRCHICLTESTLSTTIDP